MANKRTIAVSEDQYNEIIRTLMTGYLYHKPNRAVANALVTEANLGIRISDILKLRLSDIVYENGYHHLDIVEIKTKKLRNFRVPESLYNYLMQYCMENGIGKEEKIFPLTERNIQLALKNVVDYLGYDTDKIGTHSFRKLYAQGAWEKSGHNLLIVQNLLQHSSPGTTQRYLGINSAELNRVIENNLRIPVASK